MREDRGKQVGGLPGPAASRVHGRRCPGRARAEALLLPSHAPGSRGPHREASELRAAGEVRGAHRTMQTRVCVMTWNTHRLPKWGSAVASHSFFCCLLVLHFFLKDIELQYLLIG